MLGFGISGRPQPVSTTSDLKRNQKGQKMREIINNLHSARFFLTGRREPVFQVPIQQTSLPSITCYFQNLRLGS